ncbi:MAG: FtsQ-type POTRA domain-containing protein [Acidobacteria bacterium]|nr:FtsQ-type POTRA domain-containing protein [Acidobacteriota bacterium]
MDATEDDIPISEELEEEEESPFRRRQKPVQVRRGRFARFRFFLKWTIITFLVMVPVGYIAYRLGYFAATSPRFTVTSAENVTITGNQFVSKEEILGVFGIPASGKLSTGVNIFKIWPEEKRRQLETIPWVRSATVSRGYPDRLAVTIVERTPVAFVNLEGKMKLVDGDGVLLEKPEKAGFNFPVLTGLDEAAGLSERRARLAIYQEFTENLAEEAPRAGWLISEVDLADPDDLKAVLVQGNETLLVHFGHGDFSERFQSFLTLLPEVRKANARIDSIDLRYRNQIVVNPQSPAR